jgi:hypothetical protein
MTEAGEMSPIEKIIQSKLKPKDKIEGISREIIHDKSLVPAVIALFRKGKDAERGLCMETLERVSELAPEHIVPYLGFILDQINDKAPRVKWESSRIIASMARICPEETTAAVPMLLKNTKDEGTVVRWSAARALTEIAKYHSKAKKELLPRLKALEKKEKNGGVKNVYRKAFKALEKD